MRSAKLRHASATSETASPALTQERCSSDNVKSMPTAGISNSAHTACLTGVFVRTFVSMSLRWWQAAHLSATVATCQRRASVAV